MQYLASTRFNNTTYAENINYRITNNEKLIYGTNIRIQEKYPFGSLFYVIEMNNEENRIEGIGLIKNSLITDKKHNIYSIGDYNRYIYRGKYWISREKLMQYNNDLVEIFDTILFKGKSHLKRLSGISVITNKLFTNWPYEEKNLKENIKRIFIQEFIK